VIKCAEYPHVAISIIVMNTPYFAVVEDKGAFKLPDAPDGKATLKVWSHGRWVHEEAVEVGPRSGDLRIRPAAGKASAAAE
jgi:hypothetical protein